MMRKLSLLLFIFVVASIEVRAQLPVQAPGWNFTELTDGPHYMGGSDMSFGISGKIIHAVHVSKERDSLLYCLSTDGGLTWKKELIDDGASARNRISPAEQVSWDSLARIRNDSPLPMFSEVLPMVLDNKGNPHIMFSFCHCAIYLDHEFLEHAWRENGIWKIETVDSALHNRDLSALLGFTIDVKGTLHVVTRYWNKGTYYLRKEGTRWSVPVMIEDSMDISDFSIVTDKKCRVHLALSGYKRLNYLVSDVSGLHWKNVRLLSTDHSIHGRIALDNFERPHIIYFDANKNPFHVYCNSENKWVTTKISGLKCGFSSPPALAIDRCGNIHASFLANEENDLMSIGITYAVSTDNGDSWNVTDVDPPQDHGATSDVYDIILCDTILYIGYEYDGYKWKLASHPLDRGCTGLTANAHLPEERTFTLVSDSLHGRAVKVQNEVMLNCDVVTVYIYDDGKIDHDSISVFCNGKWVLENIPLTDKGVQFQMELKYSHEDYIVIHVTSEGDQSGCPVNVSLSPDNKKRKAKKMVLHPDLRTSGMVRIVKG